jgi:hypothetical protein
MTNHFVFLPHAGVMWLCTANGKAVTPLAIAPGTADAIWRLSEDGTEFGNIDQGQKRIGHYKILDQAPWVQPLKPPLTLPKRALANDILIHQGELVVGGHSQDGEALWIRSPQDDRSWISIQLPQEVRARGKSVDALFADGSKLVAIDNMKIPKWILVYELTQPFNTAQPLVIPLKSHTTYEKVHVCAEGEHTYALYSTGINHGNVHYCVSLLSKNTLTEIANWSWNKINSDWSITGDPLLFDDDLYTPETTSEPFFNTVASMKYCGDLLLLACASKGLHIGQVPDEQDIFREQVELGEFKQLPLKRLKSADRIEQAFGLPNHAYIIGKNEVGILDFELISFDALNELFE